MRKYRTMCRAWRLLLDPKGVGRVSFQALCKAARSVGFPDLARLWVALDRNRSGFVSLDEWDPVAFRTLMTFKEICYREYGSMDCAFYWGMDTNKSKTVTFEELKSFCKRYDLLGNHRNLFDYLDVNQNGFLSVDDLDFLTKWQGEKKVKCTDSFDFNAARLWLPQNKKESRTRKTPLWSKIVG